MSNLTKAVALLPPVELETANAELRKFELRERTKMQHFVEVWNNVLRSPKVFAATVLLIPVGIGPYIELAKLAGIPTEMALTSIFTHLGVTLAFCGFVIAKHRPFEKENTRLRSELAKAEELAEQRALLGANPE